IEGLALWIIAVRQSITIIIYTVRTSGSSNFRICTSFLSGFTTNTIFASVKKCCSTPITVAIGYTSPFAGTTTYTISAVIDEGPATVYSVTVLFARFKTGFSTDTSIALIEVSRAAEIAVAVSFNNA